MAAITRTGNVRRPSAKRRRLQDVLRGEISKPGRSSSMITRVKKTDFFFMMLKNDYKQK